MRFGLIGLLVMVAAEIWSIIQVGHNLGALATLVLLVAGFIFGLQLMRSQGIRALMQGAQNARPGESPLALIAEAIVKAFAGILLIIPGFISDIIALFILLPFVRKGFAGYLAKKGRLQGFASTRFGGGGFGSVFGSQDAGEFGQRRGNVYEHKGSARPEDQPTAQGRILEHEPDRKD